MKTGKKNYFKFFITLILCLLVRLIPLRAPNIEPIMAGTMPIGRVYGALGGFSFAVLSILLYDLLTHTLGVQTIFTVLAYGLIGLASFYYFSAKGGSASGGQDSVWSYVRFAIVGTLFFDAVTGLTVGPIFFHQSFAGSLIGQIPFTALHLLGNVTFAFVLSPSIYNFLIKKRKKESWSLTNILNPKAI